MTLSMRRLRLATLLGLVVALSAGGCAPVAAPALVMGAPPTAATRVGELDTQGDLELTEAGCVERLRRRVPSMGGDVLVLLRVAMVAGVGPRCGGIAYRRTSAATAERP